MGDLRRRLVLVAGKADSDQRGPHPGQLFVLLDGGQYALIRLLDDFVEGCFGVQLLQCLYRDAAGYLAGLRPTNPVGHGEQRSIDTFSDEQGILVVLADLAGVRDTEVFEE